MSQKPKNIVVRGKVWEEGKGVEIYEDYMMLVNALPVGEYVVKIEHIGKGKDAMYAFYHSIIIPIGMMMLRDTGEQADEAYTDMVFKGMFAKKKVRNPVTGEENLVLTDKRDMSYGRLNQFLNDVIQFLEECGYEVPEPEIRWRSNRVK